MQPSVDQMEKVEMRRSISAQHGHPRKERTRCSIGPGHSIDLAKSYEALPQVSIHKSEGSGEHKVNSKVQLISDDKLCEKNIFMTEEDKNSKNDSEQIFSVSKKEDTVEEEEKQDGPLENILNLKDLLRLFRVTMVRKPQSQRSDHTFQYCGQKYKVGFSENYQGQPLVSPDNMARLISNDTSSDASPEIVGPFVNSASKKKQSTGRGLERHSSIQMGQIQEFSPNATRPAIPVADNKQPSKTERIQSQNSFKINKHESISPEEAEGALMRSSQPPMVAPRFESHKVYDPVSGLPLHEEVQVKAFDYKKYQEQLARELEQEIEAEEQQFERMQLYDPVTGKKIEKEVEDKDFKAIQDQLAMELDDFDIDDLPDLGGGFSASSQPAYKSPLTKAPLHVIQEVDESKDFIYDPLTGSKIKQTAMKEDDDFKRIQEQLALELDDLDLDDLPDLGGGSKPVQANKEQVMYDPVTGKKIESKNDEQNNFQKIQAQLLLEIDEDDLPELPGSQASKKQVSIDTNIKSYNPESGLKIRPLYSNESETYAQMQARLAKEVNAIYGEDQVNYNSNESKGHHKRIMTYGNLPVPTPSAVNLALLNQGSTSSSVQLDEQRDFAMRMKFGQRKNDMIMSAINFFPKTMLHQQSTGLAGQSPQRRQLIAAIALQSQQSLISCSPQPKEKRLNRSHSIGSLENKQVLSSQMSQFAIEMVQNNAIIEKELQKERSEKEQLIQKLIEAEKAILKVKEEELADNTKIHLALLFASPLVFSTYDQNERQTFKDIPLLEFENEFKEVEESLVDTGMEVRVKMQQATQSNLTRILTSNPLSLHFTGHGVEANETSIKNEGNCLIFETEDGEADLVTEKLLTELIQQSDTKLEFVYVASCHSEFAGEIFLNAGAKHVICIRGDQELSDQAAIVFSKSFYNSVFKKTLSICSSFNFAKKCVEKIFGKQEAFKYLLLKHPKHQHDPKSCVLRQLKGGKLEKLDNLEAQALREIPSKVEGFVGRQTEMYQVLKNIHQNRLVSLLGLPGIGKSSLAKNLIFYLMKRSLFRGGVIFISIKGQNSIDNFLKAILMKVKKAIQKVRLDLTVNEKLSIIHNESQTKDQIQTKILQMLQQIPHKFLIILDNIEEVLFYDKANVRDFIYKTLAQVENCNFLVTSRPPLGAMQDFKEKILVLKELSTFQTMKLFISRAEEIPEEEINELLCYTEEEEVLRKFQEQIKKKRDSKLKKDKQPVKIQYYKKLADHHLFRLLSGNPHAIVLSAPLIGTDKMKLIDLYKTLNSKEMHEILKVDGIENCSMASLRVSLEASVNVLRKDDHESLIVFYLIGLLPGGVNEEQLQEMYGALWDRRCRKLTEFSLVSEFIKEIQLDNSEDDTLGTTINKQQMTTFDTHDEEFDDDVQEITVQKLQKKISFGLAEQFKKTKKIRLFNLQPFMNSYVEAKVPLKLKKELQQKICKHYVKMLRELYRKNAKIYQKQVKYNNALTQEGVLETLLKHETNIRACIERIIELNGNKDEKEEQKIHESIVKNLGEELSKAKLQKSKTMKNKQDEEKSVTFGGASEDMSLARQSVDKSPLFSKAFTSESKKHKPAIKQKQSEGSTPFNDQLTVVQTFSHVGGQQKDVRISQPDTFNIDGVCMTQRDNEQEREIKQIIESTKVHVPISTKHANKDSKFVFTSSQLSSQKSKCYMNRNSKIVASLKRLNSGLTMQKQKTLRQSLMAKNTFGARKYDHNEEDEEIDQEGSAGIVEDISEEANEDDSFGTDDDDLNRHTSIVEISPEQPQQKHQPKGEKKGLLQIQAEESGESDTSSAKHFFREEEDEQVNSMVRASNVQFGQNFQVQGTEQTLKTDENLFTEPTEKRDNGKKIRISGVNFQDQEDGSSSGDENFPLPGQQEVNKVIRDSQVFFKKEPSTKEETYNSKATLHIKRASTVAKQGRKRSAVPEESNEEDSEDEWEKLNLQEELVVYYLLNLLLANQDEQAKKFLEKYAFKVSKNSLYLANIFKIQGMIHYNSKRPEQSIDSFEKSMAEFKKCNSVYGQSLCSFAHGFILKTKFDMMNQEIFEQIKAKINQAFAQFEEIDHLPGQSLCLQQLTFIAKHEKDKKAESKYQSNSMKISQKIARTVGRKNSFHVNRTQGPVFSLFIEIIDGAWYNMLSKGLSKSQKKPQSPGQPTLQIGKAKSEMKQQPTSFNSQEKKKSKFTSPGKTNIFDQKKEPLSDDPIVDQEHPVATDRVAFDRGDKRINVFEMKREENRSMVPLNESFISVGEESKRNSVISEEVQNRKLPNTSNIKPKESPRSKGVEMVYHPHPSLFTKKGSSQRAETPKFQEPDFDRPSGDISPRPNIKVLTHSPPKKESLSSSLANTIGKLGNHKHSESVVLCEDEELKTPQQEKGKFTKSLLEPEPKEDNFLVKLSAQSARANAVLGPQLQSFKNQFTSLFSSNQKQEVSRQITNQSNEGKSVPVLARNQVRFQIDKQA